MNVRLLKIAQLDLDAAIDYYNSERRGLGYEFLWEVLFMIDRIKQFPHAWQIFHDDSRRCIIRRFPYGIIYMFEEDTLVILAIANLHREPEYWIKRLPENL